MSIKPAISAMFLLFIINTPSLVAEPSKSLSVTAKEYVKFARKIERIAYVPNKKFEKISTINCRQLRDYFGKQCGSPKILSFLCKKKISHRNVISTHLKAISKLHSRTRKYCTPNIYENYYSRAATNMMSLYNFSYSVPLTYETFQKKAGTLGITVVRKPQGYVVWSLKFNSELIKKGVERGDVIERINQVAIKLLSIDNVKNMLVGRDGSRVVLQVKEPNGKSREISVRRRIPNGDNFYSMYKNEWITYYAKKTLYMRLRSFVSGRINNSKPPGMHVRFISSIYNKYLHKTRKIIFDLRGNTGGSLVAIAKLAGLIMGERKLVHIRTREKPILLSSKDFKRLNKKLVIFIDGSTASGAILFAAAMKHHYNAKIIGTLPDFQKSNEINMSIGVGPYSVNVPVATMDTIKTLGRSMTSLVPDRCVLKTNKGLRLTSFNTSDCRAKILSFSASPKQEAKIIVDQVR